MHPDFIQSLTLNGWTKTPTAEELTHSLIQWGPITIEQRSDGVSVLMDFLGR